MSSEREWVEAPECPKCQGEGWLWGKELDNPDDDTYDDTMTRYTCDGPIHRESPPATDPENVSPEEAALDDWMERFTKGTDPTCPTCNGAEPVDECSVCGETRFRGDVSGVVERLENAIGDGFIGENETPLDDYGKEVVRECVAILQPAIHDLQADLILARQGEAEAQQHYERLKDRLTDEEIAHAGTRGKNARLARDMAVALDRLTGCGGVVEALTGEQE